MQFKCSLITEKDLVIISRLAHCIFKLLCRIRERAPSPFDNSPRAGRLGINEVAATIGSGGGQIKPLAGGRLLVNMAVWHKTDGGDNQWLCLQVGGIHLVYVASFHLLKLLSSTKAASGGHVWRAKRVLSVASLERSITEATTASL